jgi:hypothetical protein
MRQWIAAAVLAVIAALAVPASARAGLIPVQVSVTPQGGYYQFTYAIVLPTDAVLQKGDYFTIYNFAGLVPGSASSSGSLTAGDWSFTSSPTGKTPPGVVPTDDPTLPNLTWTYNGPVQGGNQIGLGNFWALSLYPDTTQSWFTALTGTVYGTPDANITPTSVPVPAAPPPGVPEPSILALAVIAFPILGAVRWYRRDIRARMQGAC